MGLAGRGAATIPALFPLSWRLWRGVSVLSTPTPEAVPLSTHAVTRLVRSAASVPDSPPSAPRAATRVLLVHPLAGPRLDPTVLVGDIGLVAGIFDRSVLRISQRGAPSTDELLATVRERFDVPQNRLTSARAVPVPRAVAAIEILAEP
jgi:hypothetical protein